MDQGSHAELYLERHLYCVMNVADLYVFVQRRASSHRDIVISALLGRDAWRR